MMVLVTGANGFLGSAVLRHLMGAGYSVRVLLREGSEESIIKGLNIEIVRGDILDSHVLEKAVEGCKIVLHLAFVYMFYPWWKREVKDIYKTNVEGTKNLLTVSLKHRVEKFIFTSSVASIGRRANGKPSNEETVFNLWRSASHYAKSKLLAEEEVLKFCTKGLPAVILNPAIVIGERDYKPTPSGEVIVKFLNRRYPFYFEATWSIADVDDVARAHISAIIKGQSGERYILCNKKSYTIGEIFKLLEEISGIKAPRIKIPYTLLLSFVYIEEALSYLIRKTKPLMSSEGVKFCKMSIKFDNSKAVRELDYTTTSLRNTLTKAVTWYRENGYIKNAQINK